MGQCKSSLSAPRQQLVQIIRQLYFGTIESEIKGGEPVFEPPPKVVHEFKLGVEGPPTPSSVGTDFELKKAVVDLFDHFDRLRDASVVIECRHGLPARLIVAGEV